MSSLCSVPRGPTSANKSDLVSWPSPADSICFERPGLCESIKTLLHFFQRWSFDFAIDYLTRRCKILKNILKQILLTRWLSSEVVSNAIVHLFSPPRFSIPSDPPEQG